MERHLLRLCISQVTDPGQDLSYGSKGLDSQPLLNNIKDKKKLIMLKANVYELFLIFQVKYKSLEIDCNLVQLEQPLFEISNVILIIRLMKNEAYRNYALLKVIQCGLLKQTWSLQYSKSSVSKFQLAGIIHLWLQENQRNMNKLYSKTQIIGMLGCSNVKKEQNKSKQITQKYQLLTSYTLICLQHSLAAIIVIWLLTQRDQFFV